MKSAYHPIAKRNGFTITELIVVISITAVMLGTLLPAMSVVRDMAENNSAVSTIAAAVQATRAYATVPHANLDHSGNPDFAGFTFSGAAVLFTPANELRLVENDQNARNGSNNWLETDDQNGYKDIDGLDYLNLSDDVGVVGIARGGSIGSSERYLLTPPFAIRFNEHGHLIAGVYTLSPRVVYYDGDYSGQYIESVPRPTNYNVDLWDPSSPTYDSDNDPAWDSINQKYILLFEEIETVIGVIVYSKKDLRAADTSFNLVAESSGSVKPTVATWILDNGQTMLFSRYTGEQIGG